MSNESHEALRRLSADEFATFLDRASLQQLRAVSEIGVTSSAATEPQGLVSKYLFMPAEQSNVVSIVSWWEMRRPAYNVIVGVCGLITLALLKITGASGMSPGLILAGIFCYGVAANLCYTMGSCVHSVAWYFYPRGSSRLGPVLLLIGTLFSICLTLGAGILGLALLL